MTYVRKTGWVMWFLLVTTSNAQEVQPGQVPNIEQTVRVQPGTPTQESPPTQAVSDSVVQPGREQTVLEQPGTPAQTSNAASGVSDSAPPANTSQVHDPKAGNTSPVDSKAEQIERSAPAPTDAFASPNVSRAIDPKAGNTAPVPPPTPAQPIYSADQPTKPAVVSQPVQLVKQPSTVEIHSTSTLAPVEPSAQPDAASQSVQTPETSASEVKQAPAQQVPVQPESVRPMPTPRSRPMPTRAAPQVPKPGPDEIVGLDTVDLENPQGNWLFKRVWWERAEAKYEKIHETVTKTTEARTAFFAKRVEIEKNILDPFYLHIGFSQGELQAVLSDLNSRFETFEKTKSSQEKEDEEQAVIDSAQEEAQTLKQLQQDVDQVIKHDETLDAAVMQLSDQITRMRNYEQQAWQDFKDIARVLDDKKARELFYKVDNAWRNVQEIQAYIEQGFSTSFDRITEQIKQSVNRIMSTIATLKEKGFDLKKRAQELAGNVQEEKPQEQPGFFARVIINPIKRIFMGIASGIQMVWDYTVFALKWPFQKIMGSAPVVQESVDETEQASENADQVEQETAALEPSQTQEHVQDVMAQVELDSDELPDTMEELDLREIALNDRKSFDSFDPEAYCDIPETVMA